MAESNLIKMVIEAEDKATAIFKDLDKSIGTIDSSFGGLGGTVADITAKIGEVIAVLGAMAIAFATFAAKEAAEFESAMAKIKVEISGVPEFDISSISSGIQQLTRDIPQTADAFSSAFLSIEDAVNTGADAMNVLEVAGKAATASSSDMATVAETLATGLKALGLNADEAGTLADQLFVMVKNGRLDFDDLKSSIGGVLTASENAGQDFTEIGAAITTLAAETGKGGEAMEQMKNIIISLQTDKAQEGFQKLGISITDSTGSMRPFSEIIGEIANKQLLVNDLMDAGVEKRYANSIVTLSGNMDELKVNLDAINNSSGAVNDGFEIMMDTFSSQSDIAKNAWNEFLATVGEPILESIKPIIEDIVEKLQSLTDWEKESGAIGGAFSAWLDALSQLSSVIPSVLDHLVGVEDTAGVAGAGFLAWISDLDTIKSILNAVVTVAGGLAMAVAMIHDGIVLIGAPIGLILLGGLNLAVEAVQKFVQLLDLIPGVDLSGAVEGIQGLQDQIGEWQVGILESSDMWTDNVAMAIADVKRGIEGIDEKTQDATASTEDMADAQEETGSAIVQNEAYLDLMKGAAAETAGEMENIGTNAAKSKDEIKSATEIMKEQIKVFGDITKTSIEWESKINIAELETQAKEVEAVMSGLSESFGAAADASASMFGDLTKAMGDSDVDALEQWSLEDMMERQLDIQEKLVDAQTAYVDSISSKGLDINIKAEGGADWLSGLLQSIFEGLKMKAMAEGVNPLVGV